MELYIQVSFWLSALAVVLRGAIIAVDGYPRKTTRSGDIVGMMTTIPFLIWAAVLLWA